VDRPARTDKDAAGFIFHQGRIATESAVVQDGERRDKIRERYGGRLMHRDGGGERECKQTMPCDPWYLRLCGICVPMSFKSLLRGMRNSFSPPIDV
jgi:hypothetical protein